MKLAVLVPSAAYRENAGARIRYDRVAIPLREQGWSLELIEIDQFDPEASAFDFVIISKCFDARAILIAATLAQRGRHVGVDLFDDYFSQLADSRMVRFRRWLDQISPWLSFALCSTATMGSLVQDVRSDLPTIQLNDVAPSDWEHELSQRLEDKMVAALDERRLQFCWFGMGDNPHFQVGLKDIMAFADRLAELQRRSACVVEMTILTNARALDASGLALVASMPVLTNIEVWTEVVERSVLSRAFACFLPVNAQPFSAAKSLNRAVTALTAGCQVVSAGFPLYSPFGEFIYRDEETFVADFNAGGMKLSAHRLALLEPVMEDHASPAREVERLIAALRSLDPPALTKQEKLALVHGVATNGATHKLVHKLQGLSVAGPYATAKLGYDVIFKDKGPNAPQMFIAQRQLSQLTDAARARLEPATDIDGKRYSHLPPVDGQASDRASSTAASLPLRLACYERATHEVERQLRDAFGPLILVLSENSTLPFDAKFAP